MKDAPRGRLDVVATPIGNLGDLSSRARDAFAAADVVAAEDTRHTGQLLATLGLSKALVSLHEHNERQRVDELLARLERGEIIALASDAGTPLVSDPGAELVARAAAAGIDVRAIPGASAVTAALTVAGLPTQRFAFEGFLPAKSKERREMLRALARETRTLVFFEAPHRIALALADLTAELGAERRAALCRELTKTFETVYRGTLGELAARATSDANVARGEITLVVAGAEEKPQGDFDAAQLDRAAALLARELPPGRAAAVAAQLTGAPREAAYAAVLRAKQFE